MPITSKATVLSGTSRQSTGIVATLSGLDRKEVDKAFAQLKKDGAIVSPVRCKWQPAEYEAVSSSVIYRACKQILYSLHEIL